jgi:hypothetical protein
VFLRISARDFCVGVCFVGHVCSLLPDTRGTAFVFFGTLQEYDLSFLFGGFYFFCLRDGGVHATSYKKYKNP